MRLVTNCGGYDSVSIRSHLCCAVLGENCCLHTKAVSCIALSIYVGSSHIEGSISHRCPCFENDYYILSIAHVHMYRSTGGSRSMYVKAVILSVSSHRCPCFENGHYCQLHMCTRTEALEVAEVRTSKQLF